MWCCDQTVAKTGRALCFIVLFSCDAADSETLSAKEARAGTPAAWFNELSTTTMACFKGVRNPVVFVDCSAKEEYLLPSGVSKRWLAAYQKHGSIDYSIAVEDAIMQEGPTQFSVSSPEPSDNLKVDTFPARNKTSLFSLLITRTPSRSIPIRPAIVVDIFSDKLVLRTVILDDDRRLVTDCSPENETLIQAAHDEALTNATLKVFARMVQAAQ